MQVAGFYAVSEDKKVKLAKRLMIKNSEIFDVEAVMQSEKFLRWYKDNKRAVNYMALATPVFTMELFGFNTVLAASSYSLMDGHGVILLNMLILGFITLLVTTFLKFTGRGDIVPLVAFVSGGIILYQVMGLFNDIYSGIAGFLRM